MLLAVKVVSGRVRVAAIPVAFDLADFLEVLAKVLEFRRDGSHGEETLVVRVEIEEEVVVEDEGQDNEQDENDKDACERRRF